MTKNTIIVLCALFTGPAVCSTRTVRAQQPTPVERPMQDGRGYIIKEPTGSVSEFSRPQPIESKVVKNAPYSAEIVTESVQTLGDGNRIVQRSTSRVYRDVEGRVRREDDRPSGSPSISITDPVAHTSTTLDPANRTARETSNAIVMDLYVEALQTLSSEVRRATVNPEPAASGAGGRGRGAGVSEVPTPASAAGGGNAAAGGRGGRGAGSGPERVVRRQQVEEQLPGRMIEGVLATGVRRTTTIPKDAIGNEQPITIVSEEWTSPDLQVLVLTDVNDPRTGHSTYKLQRIVRVDPDPSLFRVPPDYTLQRAGGRGRGGLE